MFLQTDPVFENMTDDDTSTIASDLDIGDRGMLLPVPSSKRGFEEVRSTRPATLGSRASNRVGRKKRKKGKKLRKIESQQTSIFLNFFSFLSFFRQTLFEALQPRIEARKD